MRKKLIEIYSISNSKSNGRQGKGSMRMYYDARIKKFRCNRAGVYVL